MKVLIKTMHFKTLFITNIKFMKLLIRTMQFMKVIARTVQLMKLLIWNLKFTAALFAAFCSVFVFSLLLLFITFSICKMS
jgi:hypothetical protein